MVLSTDCFDKYKRGDVSDKLYGRHYYLVILVALSMQVGTFISKDQIAYARYIYKSAGLFIESIEQFGRALREYRNKPYDFKARGVMQMIQEMDKLDDRGRPLKSFGNINFFGKRYYLANEAWAIEPSIKRLRSDIKSRNEVLQPSVKDPNAPPTCGYCGKLESEMRFGGRLKRCRKCKKERYCDRDCQASDWPIHKKGCTAA